MEWIALNSLDLKDVVALGSRSWLRLLRIDEGVLQNHFYSYHINH